MIPGRWHGTVVMASAEASAMSSVLCSGVGEIKQDAFANNKRVDMT